MDIETKVWLKLRAETFKGLELSLMWINLQVKKEATEKAWHSILKLLTWVMMMILSNIRLVVNWNKKKRGKRRIKEAILC
jgi:hypothetical protein